MDDIVQAMNICIDFFGLCILMFILIILWFGHWRNDRLQHYFIGLILSYFGVIISYAIVHLNDGELSAPVYLIVDLISFASSSFSMYFFSHYVFTYLENRKIEQKKFILYSVLVLCVTDFLLNLGIDIYSGDITREWTTNETLVSWSATGIWGIIMIGNIIYFRKQLGLRTFICFIFYYALPFFAGSLAPFIEGLRIDIISITFMIASLFIVVQANENTSHRMFEKLSFHDAMTGLFNRNYLIMNPDDMRRKLPCSYVVFDLNNLKMINDNYGHSKGDEYIQSFADILKKIVPDNAETIRTGGDEFLVIIPKYDQEKCETFLKTYSDECKSRGVTESASHGYAVRTTGLQSEEEVIAIADGLMYSQKKASKMARK